LGAHYGRKYRGVIVVASTKATRVSPSGEVVQIGHIRSVSISIHIHDSRLVLRETLLRETLWKVEKNSGVHDEGNVGGRLQVSGGDLNRFCCLVTPCREQNILLYAGFLAHGT
jgi:hypothetical protein